MKAYYFSSLVVLFQKKFFPFTHPFLVSISFIPWSLSVYLNQTSFNMLLQVFKYEQNNRNVKK